MTPALASSHAIHVLDNGLTVVLVHMPGAHAATLSFAVQAGPMFERPAALGATHLLEHALLHGSSEHPNVHALRIAFEDLGVEPEIIADIDTMTVDLTVPWEGLCAAIATLGDMVAHPVFEGIEAHLVHSRLEAEGLFNADLPSDPVALFHHHFYEDHPAGRPGIGTPASLAKITPAVLAAEHKRLFTGSNAVLTVIGDFAHAHRDPTLFLRLVRQSFDLARGERLVPAPFTPRRRTIPNLVFAESSTPPDDLLVMAGFHAPGWSDRLGPATKLLLWMLGEGRSSRMSKALLDTRLCGQAFAEMSGANVAPMAVLGFDPTSSHKAGEAVQALFATLKQVSTAGVYPKELERAQRLLLASIETEIDHPEAHADFFRLRPLTEPSEALGAEAFLARLKAVTTLDVQEAARMMFVPERLIMVVMGALEFAVNDIAAAVALFAGSGVSGPIVGSVRKMTQPSR